MTGVAYRADAGLLVKLRTVERCLHALERYQVAGQPAATRGVVAGLVMACLATAVRHTHVRSGTGAGSRRESQRTHACTCCRTHPFQGTRLEQSVDALCSPNMQARSRDMVVYLRNACTGLAEALGADPDTAADADAVKATLTGRAMTWAAVVVRDALPLPVGACCGGALRSHSMRAVLPFV